MKSENCLSGECDFESEGGMMLAARRGAVALYVDRAMQQWVVRDPDGEFWRLPSVDDCWEHREPFQLTEETELEIIPGHYRHMLNLPF